MAAPAAAASALHEYIYIYISRGPIALVVYYKLPNLQMPAINDIKIKYSNYTFYRISEKEFFHALHYVLKFN